MPLLHAVLLVVASGSLALGLTLPLVRVDRLWLFEDRPSLLDIVQGLGSEGEWLLALAVALFSVVFPIAKLVTAQLAAIERSIAPPRWLSALSKWSMMDVLLVALAIFAAKTSGLAAAASEPGLWFYGLSAFSALAATYLGSRRVGRSETQ